MLFSVSPPPLFVCAKNLPASVSLQQGSPARREPALQLDAHFLPRSVSRFRPFAALTTCPSPNHPYLIHACLVHTSQAPAPVPLSGAALTASEIRLRDPQRRMPENQLAFSGSESPPRSSHPACKTPSPSTSRLASCALAPIFIFTSECPWTVGRRNGRIPFSSNSVWTPGNQAIIDALKVVDDTATSCRS